MKNQHYQHSSAQEWSTLVTSQILEYLQQNIEERKFIADCIIIQKGIEGINSDTSCLWDESNDGLKNSTKKKKMLIKNLIYLFFYFNEQRYFITDGRMEQ